MSRHLRIAAAVVFALLGLALAALWVRSHQWYEGVSAPIGDKRLAGLEHCRGMVMFDLSRWDDGRFANQEWTWTTEKASIYSEEMDWIKTCTPLRSGFRLVVRPTNGVAISFPHWFLVASSLTFAALLAFKSTWRFSLRSVLFATTILAALLGMAVYAA